MLLENLKSLFIQGSQYGWNYILIVFGVLVLFCFAEKKDSDEKTKYLADAGAKTMLLWLAGVFAIAGVLLMRDPYGIQEAFAFFNTLPVMIITGIAFAMIWRATASRKSKIFLALMMIFVILGNINNNRYDPFVKKSVAYGVDESILGLDAMMQTVESNKKVVLPTFIASQLGKYQPEEYAIYVYDGGDMGTYFDYANEKECDLVVLPGDIGNPEFLAEKGFHYVVSEYGYFLYQRTHVSTTQ
ncbi:MAG: hypothetical protein PUB19_08740 [Lachnospiraceae bacterium]|nr:hypothetical protein [Lachnospiraceae bacterium]